MNSAMHKTIFIITIYIQPQKPKILGPAACVQNFNPNRSISSETILKQGFKCKIPNLEKKKKSQRCQFVRKAPIVHCCRPKAICTSLLWIHLPESNTA